MNPLCPEIQHVSSRQCTGGTYDKSL
jgi:hypothetical protein